MGKAFSTAALKALMPKLARKSDQLIDIIKNIPPKQPVEFQRLMVRFVFDVVGVGGYGIDFKSLENEQHPCLEAIQYCMHDALASTMNPFRRLVKWAFPMCKLARECNSMYSQMYSFYDMIANEIRERGEPAEDDLSMSACLMRIKDPNVGGPLNDALLSSEVGGFMIAATDTTSHSIAWALFAIASHPKVQQKIVDELKTSGLLHRIKEGATDRVSYSEIMGLEWLGMAMKEVIRMFPVVPIGSMRITAADGMNVYGYRVPKGTVVSVNVHCLNYSPLLWDDPGTFNPERWRKMAPTEQAGTEFAPQPSTKGNPRILWAFSDGPRNCLGQRMAMMEMHLVVAVLLAHFELRLAERMGGWEEALSRQYLAGVLCIDGGMWLDCIPRQTTEK
ncbi:unnamed protein product [Ostreobium quekettii]|uniref:Cytochrome P450 n=1 Tax=Ostreobium quekettii TaxID=121088 RepID=A0A8S1JAL3_9CHLO|nr:unnamed protein product [Ostreobium quekettii]